MTTTIIVLAMHGAPPSDFPRQEAGELFGLRGRLERAAPADRPALEQRLSDLDAKMRAWPRSAGNDPYYAGSQDLAHHLRQATGLPLLVGFNEFCAPSLDEALDQAAAALPGRIIVVTPMMTRGGEHVEHEIPAAVGRAQSRYPAVRVEYLWPFDVAQVADFLAARIAAWS
jgi:sirohydrochlorin cobaltochelatase